MHKLLVLSAKDGNVDWVNTVPPAALTVLYIVWEANQYSLQLFTLSPGTPSCLGRCNVAGCDPGTVLIIQPGNNDKMEDET